MNVIKPQLAFAPSAAPWGCSSWDTRAMQASSAMDLGVNLSTAQANSINFKPGSGMLNKHLLVATGAPWVAALSFVAGEGARNNVRFCTSSTEPRGLQTNFSEGGTYGIFRYIYFFIFLHFLMFVELPG